MAKQKNITNNTLPCTLCKQPLARRTDKKGKSYFVCDDCGTQFFIRRATGAARLEVLMQSPHATAGGRDIPPNARASVRAELNWIDEACDLFDEAEELLPPNADESEDALPIPEWIQQRTARVRSLLNLK